MSRVGKKPIPIIDGVKVAIVDRKVDVEGPLGKLSFTHREEIDVSLSEDGKSIDVTRHNDERESRAYHGLTRALINNMILGCEDRLREEAGSDRGRLPGCDQRQGFAIACWFRQRIATADSREFGRQVSRPNAHQYQGLRQASRGSVRSLHPIASQA